MEAIWRYFKVQLPGYLRTLPLPKSLAEITELTRDDWLTLLPFLLFLAILVYLAISPIFNICQGKKQARPKINRKVKLGEDKVVDSFDIEDLGKAIEENPQRNVVYCRCWKSKKSHACRLDFKLYSSLLQCSGCVQSKNGVDLVEFPYCDGTHNTHNKATGDNVGPLVVKNKKLK